MGFEKWNGVHDTEDQKKRIKSAQSAACTPLSISPETMSGSFSGSSGIYKTTLESCTCIDFSRRHLPCKHIYRLAIELGILDVSAESNASKVKRPASDGLSLKEAVAIVESVGEKAQRALYSVLYRMLYEKRAQAVGVKKTPEISVLVSSGILMPCDDLRTQIEVYGRNELLDILLSAGVSGFKKNTSRDVLVCWIIENVPDASRLFPDAVAVRLSDNFLKTKQKVYTYLGRRNENEEYYDFNLERLVLHPKGADFSIGPVTVIQEGSGTSFTIQSPDVIEFPDDEITDLLDLYGVNRCHGWKLEQQDV